MQKEKGKQSRAKNKEKKAASSPIMREPLLAGNFCYASFGVAYYEKARVIPLLMRRFKSIVEEGKRPSLLSIGSGDALVEAHIKQKFDKYAQKKGRKALDVLLLDKYAVPLHPSATSFERLIHDALVLPWPISAERRFSAVVFFESFGVSLPFFYKEARDELFWQTLPDGTFHKAIRESLAFIGILAVLKEAIGHLENSGFLVFDTSWMRPEEFDVLCSQLRLLPRVRDIGLIEPTWKRVALLQPFAFVSLDS